MRLTQRATPGLHDEVYSHVMRLLPGKATAFLDLGAGTGSWSNRLLDSGLEDGLAVDIDATHYQGRASFVEADLNADFSSGVSKQDFQLITAIEVIEHLENPTHFLRQCARLLAPTGVLVITTPNLESAPARIKFLLSGRLRHFDRQGDSTHISPIDGFLLDRLAARAGLSVCQRVPLVRWWQDRRWLFLVISRVLAAVVRGASEGACTLFVLRHARSTIAR